jgi:hypothetical protein
MHAIPTTEKIFRLICDCAADFHDEPSAWTQRPLRLRNQTGNDLGPSGAGKYGLARLKLANLELNVIFLGFADIRRIRHNKIKPAEIETFQKICLVELDAIFKLMAGCVGASDFECSR